MHFDDLEAKFDNISISDFNLHLAKSLFNSLDNVFLFQKLFIIQTWFFHIFFYLVIDLNFGENSHTHTHTKKTKQNETSTKIHKKIILPKFSF